MKYIFYRSNILDQYPEVMNVDGCTYKLFKLYISECKTKTKSIVLQKVAYLVTKALCRFYKISRDAHPSLTISLATSGMELTDTLELKSENSSHILDLPSLPTKVFIYATGAGCSTVQVKRLFYL